MDNKVLAEMIRDKYYEEKMAAEYKLQLNKVVEMEDKFLKDFSKNKWKDLSNLVKIKLLWLITQTGF